MNRLFWHAFVLQRLNGVHQASLAGTFNSQREGKEPARRKRIPWKSGKEIARQDGTHRSEHSKKNLLADKHHDVAICWSLASPIVTDSHHSTSHHFPLIIGVFFEC
ncbi:hypothetical protein KEM48_009955 [Puccinia striiformis f. sp. tritici PST-130]|nr:hypothetical protein KEM48_009955 [Puccinia striiformis f. sp. tritici PST-130]